MQDKPRRIMHLIASNAFGGPEKQIVEHLVRLDRERYQGLVASFNEKNRPSEILDHACRRGLPAWGIDMAGPWDGRALVRLGRLVDEARVDILCVHGYKSAVFGLIAARRRRLPVLAFSRGYTGENLKVIFYEWLERQALKRADGIVSVSHGQKERLTALGVRGRRSWVVHNAVGAANGRTCRDPVRHGRVCESLGVPRDARLIVAAGRLSPEKGHRFLIDAIGRVSKVMEGVTCVLCGDGPCRTRLERQAHEMDVEHVCRFAGFRRDLDAIFTAMDLLVLPSLTEGFPNVVLEAFACAQPVVATRVGGVPEVVEDGISGFLVSPARADLLADKIRECLNDPVRMRAMGEAGRRRVEQDFTFERQAQELESIYAEVSCE